MANNKTISIVFPFQDDEVDGKLLKMSTTTTEDIRSSLYFFLSTKKGERWYDPNFGSRIHEFIFEKNDNIVASEIQQSIKNDIEEYFKNLTIEDIQIDQSQNVNSLTIFISFIYNSIQDTLAIVFT